MFSSHHLLIFVKSIHILDMKIHVRSILIYSIFLLANTSAIAFQYADATAPKPVQSAKYIFYWGQQQCDLTAERQYKGSISLTPSAFRQILLSTPKLWNGSGLILDFSFDLQQFKVRSKDYLTQIASLDQQFGQSAKAGQVFSITGLDLGNGNFAQIDLELTEPDKEKKQLFGAQGYAPFLNERLMETIVWGPQEKINISERDFFTVSECWQILGQEPYLEWRSWQEAQPVMAELQIIDAEEVTLSLRLRLEENAYSEFVNQVRVYQHLIKPGIRATLLLQTSNQYERLYQKSMQLVAEGDERLRLRRNRDFHKIEFRWLAWNERMENLYLKSISDPQGNALPVDLPVNRWAFASGPMDSLSAWAAQAPRIWLDNELVENASYTLSIRDSIAYQVKNGRFDSAQLQQIFTQDQLSTNGWSISNIELPGYQTPFIHLSLRNNFFTRDYLKSQNDLNTLQKNARTIPGYQIKAPVLLQDKWTFEMESPRRTDLIISVFQIDGWHNYWEDIIVNAGVNSHSVPAHAIWEKGKYTAFMISSIGVAKVEFEVP